MEPTEKELEDRLKDLGIRLSSPPSCLDDLLLLLDQTEIYLSRVEQSPSKSMSDALGPIINSLITKELLNHPETNVKVFVAACINEITRITAPDAPYNDSLMKDIFAVIVDVFGKLDDISGPSYSKKVSILETVAKVRSCVVMLDLECDDLILQMFKHFLKSIRPEHSINVFSSMETIMSLVLEDSEGISEELLFCLLSNAHKSKKDVMPVACRLAETVISNCAMKLKPYLLAAAKLKGFCLGDYVDIVASICQECSVEPEQNVVQESKLPERTVHNELPQACESKKSDKSESCFQDFGTFADKAKKVLSNGLVPRGNHNPIVEPVSSVFKHENSSYSEQCRNNTALKTEDVNFSSINEKPCNELDSKHVEAKSSSVQLPYASDSSRIEDDKEASSPITRRIGRKRKGKSLRSDMAPETEVLLEPEREVELQPLEGLVGDDKCVISATASDNLLVSRQMRNSKSLKSDGAFDIASKTTGVVEPEREVEVPPIEGQVGDSTCVISAATCKDPGDRLSKGGKSTKSQFSAKKSTPHKTALSSGKKEILENTRMEQERSPAIVLARKEDHCAVSNFDMKPSLDTAKKSLEDNATADVSTTVVSGGVSLKEEQKKHVKNATEGITFRKHWKYSIKPPKFKDAAKGDISAEPCLKEMIVSSKASREADNDGNHLGKFADTSSTKKSRRKTSGWKIHTGRKIEVWWPDDQTFYKGVIKSFDPVTRKHMVVYDDGDIEHLLLRNERWNYVDSENLEKGHEDNNVVLESSLQVPKKPQDGGSGKFKATPERGRSDAKSKGTPIQQSDEKKPTVKSSAGSKGETSKVATSSNEKIVGTCGDDGTKVDVSPQTNNSDEPPEDKTSSMVKSEEKSDGVNVFPSASAGETVKRSKRRLPKGKKNPQTVTEKTETKDDTSGDAGVVKDDTLTPVKLEGKSDSEERSGGRARRKSALKSTDKPISGRSSIGTQTDIVAFEEYSTPSITQEKRVGDVLKLTSRSVNTRKKGTPTASADGIIDVKNSASGGTKVDDSVLTPGAAESQRSVVKPNKRRRRK